MLGSFFGRAFSRSKTRLIDANRNSVKQYKLGEHTIVLGREHLLPFYQSQYPLYDRFLPILCKHLDHADKWIIDVGANVGDTAVAIAQTCTNPILCVEGESKFFDLLRQNVDALFGAREQPVRCVNKLVGTGRFCGHLATDGTTAKLAQDGSAQQRAITLDELVREAGLSAYSIGLVKVDTDGYDGDVILSGASILAGSRPMLFWENYFSTADQLKGLFELYEHLESSGYSHFWIFDNFGNLMIEECRVAHVRDMSAYLASQEFNGCTRTIHYVDVMAAPDDKIALARRAVADFRSVILRGATEPRGFTEP